MMMMNVRKTNSVEMNSDVNNCQIIELFRIAFFPVSPFVCVVNFWINNKTFIQLNKQQTFSSYTIWLNCKTDGNTGRLTWLEMWIQTGLAKLV